MSMLQRYLWEMQACLRDKHSPTQREPKDYASEVERIAARIAEEMDTVEWDFTDWPVGDIALMLAAIHIDRQEDARLAAEQGE